MTTQEPIIPFADPEPYRTGECHIFATVLHRAFGWPVHAVLDINDPWWMNPDDPDEHIPHFVHAYAVDPIKNLFWDALGARTRDALTEDLGPMAPAVWDFDHMTTETEILDWTDAATTKIEMPLFAYDTNDLEKALKDAHVLIAGDSRLPPLPKHVPLRRD